MNTQIPQIAEEFNYISMGRDQKRRIIKFTFILKHNNVNCDWGEEKGKFHSAILFENHLSLMALCIFIYGKFEKKIKSFHYGSITDGIILTCRFISTIKRTITH